MRISLTTACVVVLFLSIHTQSAYSQVTCSCENAGDKVCAKGAITCPDGCIAICSRNNACYFSCSTDMLHKRVTIKVVQQDGVQMATVLSKETGKNIQFVPDRKNVGKLYDYELTNSDIWPALEFLDRRGTVTINRVDFRTFRKIQSGMKSGRKFSVRFRGEPAHVVVSRLTFMSQLNLEIKSGDPATRVFIEANQMSLRDILKEISNTARVEIDISDKSPQKK